MMGFSSFCKRIGTIEEWNGGHTFVRVFMEKVKQKKINQLICTQQYVLIKVARIVVLSIYRVLLASSNLELFSI